MNNINKHRKFVIIAIFITFALVFIIKLFQIQVVDTSFQKAAEDNARRRIVQYPHRGLIYDRNRKLLVYNEAVYDIMVDKKELLIEDTAKLCRLLKLSLKELVEKLNKIQRDLPKALVPQLSKEEFAQIQESILDFPGIYISPRTIRAYPHQSLGNALGYIGEISPARLKKDQSGYYSSGDYIGISGIESSYEAYLRGKKGVKYVLIDAFRSEKGSLNDGAFDTSSVAGSNLISSIDLELQQYGEKLMQNKRGAIVAIEPSTGEILCIISSPFYDPNRLTGKSFSENYAKLLQVESKPLFNRAIMSSYPPGSTFKTLQALVALQQGVITEKDRFYCNKNLVNCHNHPHPTNVIESVQHSCNPFYYQVFRKVIQQYGEESVSIHQAFGDWRALMRSFGLGSALGVDIANELNGQLPEASLYDRYYGKNNWGFSNIYSVSIGQGEVGVTPIQMANMAAIIANRGYYYTPHLIKSIEDTHQPLEPYQIPHRVNIDQKNFEYVIEGMEMAFKQGTVSYQAQIPYAEFEICGKTGTVQNPKGEDHSTFMCFAPKKSPKIAIAVYVENAGFGGVWAATIASLMLEKYLTGKVSRPEIEQLTIQKTFNE